MRNAGLEEAQARIRIAGIKLPTFAGHRKAREFQKKKKTSISALLFMSKSLTVWITINCGKL